MKIDIDSILYIAIMIVVLVISGLSSRKKKRAKQMQAQAQASGAAEPDPFEHVEDESSDARATGPVKTKTAFASQQVSNPLGRLEQFLSGQFPQVETMEGESLETTVDEEELILEEIRRSREKDEMRVSEEKPAEQEEQTEKLEKTGIPPLFDNLDEVKKAIIYSEIMQRKYQ